MAASDHLHPGQVLPEHRMAALEALRRASDVMGEHPETFSMSYYNPESGGFNLERPEKTLPSGTRQISQHEFDISGDSPRYTSMWIGDPDTGLSTDSFSPEARAQFHGIRDFRREGIWHREKLED